MNGIVDVALPADRRARLLEIDAHDELQRVADLVGQRLQAPRVVDAGDRVVDRARADDDEQAMVAAVEDVAQHLPALRDGVRRRGRNRQAGVDFLRRRHRVEGGYVDVFDVLGRHVQVVSWRIMSLTAATLSPRAGQWRKSAILSCPASL